MTYRARPEDGACWVTGASMGIGEAVAIALADQGYTVYASARSKDKLSALAAKYQGKGKIVPLPLDVTDRKSVEAAARKIVDEAGGLALCIFNAGTFYPVRGKALDHRLFEKTMAINFDGVLNGLIPAVETMKEAGRGQIAIVSSVAGYSGLPKNAAYGASKAALFNMAESLKFDLDRLNIRIQIVAPGFVETPLTAKNDFPMPFLMPVEKAARQLLEGLRSGGFEVTFPKRFTWLIKLVNLFPYWLYFWLVRKATGMK